MKQQVMKIRLKRVVDIKDRAKRVYVYYLVSKEKIKKYITSDGYVAYDEEELNNWHPKTGRPPKKN